MSCALSNITIENLEAMRPKTLKDSTAENQREEITRALRETHGRVGGANGAAVHMGVNRTTLISRMKKLGIRSKCAYRPSDSFPSP